MTAIKLLELLRCRAMYGDNYSETGPNRWNPTAGHYILAAASCHVEYGEAYRESTVAMYTAQSEYFAWCDETVPGTDKTRGDMLCEGFSVNQLGGLLPEHHAEFWQGASRTAYTERAA